MRTFCWLVVCLAAAGFSMTPPASAQDVGAGSVPIRRPEQTSTQDLSEGVRLDGELVDVAVWEPGDMLIALSKSRARILALPDFSEKAETKIRGKAIACGFLAESTDNRVLFFVVSAFGRDINTYFYELSAGRIRRVGYDSSSYFRSHAGALLRQDVGRGSAIQGAVRVCVLKDRRPREVAILPLPKGTRLYSFARGILWPTNVIGVVRIESDDRKLVLYRPDQSSWDAVWEADGAFGGSLLQVSGVDPELFDKRNSEELPRPPALANLDDDPELEILAFANIPAPFQEQIVGRKYDRSQVKAFDVNGRRATIVWETDRLKGTIPNIAVWKDRWVLPLVDPAGKKTRLYLNPLIVP